MKRIIIALLLCSSLTVMAHVPLDSARTQLITARAFADPQKPFYNPKKSFDIYSGLAAKGNGEAMNALGVMYSKGLGVNENDKTAVAWFEKAANAGYGRAFYNWATMVKNGLGEPQDFKKAYWVYKKGADLSFPSSLYGQGFMLYKGLGCPQDYSAAFKLFTKSAAMDDKGAMYMKGLCFRNGYGVAMNVDSARYWLSKAAASGYRFAKEELEAAEPENTNIGNPVVIVPPATSQTPVTDIKSGYKQLKHRFTTNGVDGDYTGFAIKFDWSGKHIIAESSLGLKLRLQGKTLQGTWTEDGSDYAELEGQLNDTALVFNNSRYSKADHYNVKRPNDFEFKNAQLQLVKNADTVYITGNLQLYSTKMKEPEKPTFVMLVRNSNNTPVIDLSDSTKNKITLANSTKTDSVKFIVYPNPFSNTLNAQFILKKKCMVRLMISNLTDAHIVYQGALEMMEPGEHTLTLHLNGTPGTYVCTLNYGNQLKSAVVFKQ